MSQSVSNRQLARCNIFIFHLNNKEIERQRDAEEKCWIAEQQFGPHGDAAFPRCLTDALSTLQQLGLHDDAFPRRYADALPFPQQLGLDGDAFSRRHADAALPLPQQLDVLSLLVSGQVIKRSKNSKKEDFVPRFMKLCLFLLLFNKRLIIIFFCLS